MTTSPLLICATSNTVLIWSSHIVRCCWSSLSNTTIPPSPPQQYQSCWFMTRRLVGHDGSFFFECWTHCFVLACSNVMRSFVCWNQIKWVSSTASTFLQIFSKLYVTYDSMGTAFEIGAHKWYILFYRITFIKSPACSFTCSSTFILCFLYWNMALTKFLNDRKTTNARTCTWALRWTGSGRGFTRPGLTRVAVIVIWWHNKDDHL